MKKMTITRVLALALAMLLCLSLLPMAAMADEGGDEGDGLLPAAGGTELPPLGGEGGMPPAEQLEAVDAAATFAASGDAHEGEQIQVADPHEHVFSDEYTTVTAATCGEAGVGLKHCTVEGCTETQECEIPATGAHVYAEAFTTDKEATCGEAGSESRHCTVCGAKTDVTEIPATGEHNYVNGVCTVCGEPDPDAAAPKVTVNVTVTGSGFVLIDGEGKTGTFEVEENTLQPSVITVLPATGFFVESFKVAGEEILPCTDLLYKFYADNSPVNIEAVFALRSGDAEPTCVAAETGSDDEQLAAVKLMERAASLSDGAQIGLWTPIPCWDRNIADPLSKDDIPADGLSFLLPYPDGVGKDTHDILLYRFINNALQPVGSGVVLEEEGARVTSNSFPVYGMIAVPKETGRITVYRTADPNGEKNIVEPLLGQEYTLIAYHFSDGDFSNFNTMADGSGTPYQAGSKVTLTAEAPTLELFVVQPAETVAVTVTITGKGTIDYGETKLRSGDSVQVPKGEPAVFTFSPETDWGIKAGSVKQNGVETGVLPDGYTFDADGTLEVVYIEKLKGTVTITGDVMLDKQISANVRLDNARDDARKLSYQWLRNGEMIAGATKNTYTLVDEDAEKGIRCEVTSDREVGKLTSDEVVPAARPAAPASPKVEAHIIADAALGGHSGSITGLDSSMEYLTGGKWAPAGSSLPVAVPGSYSFRYKATATAPASAAAVVEVKHYVAEVKFSGAKGNEYHYDISLMEKARDGSTSPAADKPGEEVPFLIPYQSGMSKDSHSYRLVHDADKKEIALTARDDGLLGKAADFSPFTLSATPAVLTGEVSIQGTPTVGQTLTASLVNSNNSGVPAYQWLRDGTPVAGADKASYTITPADLNRKLQCVVTSSVQSGSLQSREIVVTRLAAQDIINDGVTQQGKILGVSADMEYSPDGGKTWLPVPGPELPVAAPGVYYFRNKGETAVIGTVEVKAYYSVWVNIVSGARTGSVTALGGLPYDTNCWLVEKGGSITLSFRPGTRYRMSSLKINGAALQATSVLPLRNVNQYYIIEVAFRYYGSSPKTGDTSNLGLWSALGLISLAALGTIGVYSRKRRRS